MQGAVYQALVYLYNSITLYVTVISIVRILITLIKNEMLPLPRSLGLVAVEVG